MRFTTFTLCFSLLSVIGIGLVATLESSNQADPTGLTTGNRFTPKAPQQEKYCHGWEHGLEACFTTKDGLKLFKCQNYYWLQVKKTTKTCCQTYFDCSRTGEFKMPSYCDPNNFICKTR